MFQAFYVQPDGAIGSVMQVGGGRWRASAITQPGLVRVDSPLAAVRLGREISVFFVAPNGSVSRIFAGLVTDAIPHVTAEAITPAGSAGNGTDLAAALRRNNEWHVFYQTTTGAIVDVFFVPVGARFAPRVAAPGWQSPVQIAPPFVAAPRSPIASLTRNNTQVHVFFVQPDNAVATTYGTDELFRIAPVTITPPGASRGDSPLAAAIHRDEVIHVFYVSSDGSLATTSMVRANVIIGPLYPWRTPFLITPPGAAGRGSRIAAVEHRDDQLHVFYQGPDGALATTWAVAPLPYPSGPWQTPLPITPPGAGSSGSPIVAVTGK
ncbi:MAG: hypothetical protein QN168_01215 [Armatimonadota bacterium]|nr:hypothetical protein [Armatimonadota bacterium]